MKVIQEILKLLSYIQRCDSVYRNRLCVLVDDGEWNELLQIGNEYPRDPSIQVEPTCIKVLGVEVRKRCTPAFGVV